MNEPDATSNAGIEWPTVMVALCIYGGWAALLVFHESIPTPLTILGLAVLVAWFGSLRHEVLHGHPFGNQRLNDLVGFAPLSLLLPYSVYKSNHLAHHRSSLLTIPEKDTESYYCGSERWAASSEVGRRLMLAHHTLAGRMILGPIVATHACLAAALGEIRNGDRATLLTWTVNAGAAAGVLYLVVGIAHMQWWVYVLGACYLSQSLGLVRSYCEHRWVPEGRTKSAVVKSGPFFSLLFLNNNLHHAHHARGELAWYKLPALAVELGSAELAREGAGLYAGYREVFRRFAVRPFDHPVYPPERAATAQS